MKLKKSFTKILFLIISMSFTVAMAEDKPAAECIPQESLDFALNNFKIEQLDTDGNVTKTFSQSDICDQAMLRQTVKAIDYLRKIPKKELGAVFQTVVATETPTNFLTKRIKTIQFEAQDSTECKVATGAFVVNREPIMHLCPRMQRASELTFAQVLVHEARHTEGFPHVKCEQGVMTELATRACDDSYQKQGSYGIGLGFMFQVYFTTRNEAVKQEARAGAIQDVLNRFNKLPMGLAKGAIILDGEDSISFYDGKEETRFGSMADEVSTIAFVSNIPYIFFKNGKISSYDFTRDWAYRKGALVDNYKKLSQQERNEILDVLANSKEYCFLSPSRIQCPTKQGFDEYQFSSIVPVSFVNLNQSYNSDILVLAKDGKTYQLPTSKEFSTVKDSDLKLRESVHIYPDVTSYAELANGSTLGISHEGLMMIKQPGDAQWSRAKVFGDYKFKKILPYKWSKRLESL